MECPRCRVRNPDDARFCEDCGARLELACPSCGQPVGIGKKFCRACGATLAAQAQSPAPAAPESYTPKLVAHCHLALGRLRRISGEPRRAQEHLARALTLYREMEMSRWLAEAEQALG